MSTGSGPCGQGGFSSDLSWGHAMGARLGFKRHKQYKHTHTQRERERETFELMKLSTRTRMALEYDEEHKTS